MLIVKGYVLLLAGVSTVGFVLMGIDKWKARSGRWRTPEKTLMTVAFCGGAIGAWVGMTLFRHKTQHRLFAVGLPAMALAQILIGLWLVYRGV